MKGEKFPLRYTQVEINVRISDYRIAKRGKNWLNDAINGRCETKIRVAAKKQTRAQVDPAGH